MIACIFEPPDRIASDRFHQIRTLIEQFGDVLTSLLEENLRNAFLIGAALEGQRVIGTSVHKRQRPEYRKKIEAATGLDLTGFLERGYTTVHPDYRKHDIADRLIKGLMERSSEKAIYVTIRMDNPAPLKLTHKNGMTLAATYRHPITGNRLGVFMNQTGFYSINWKSATRKV